jgi:hypothetical protein
MKSHKDQSTEREHLIWYLVGRMYALINKYGNISDEDIVAALTDFDPDIVREALEKFKKCTQQN